MTLSQISLILLTVLMLSIGQILFKLASNDLELTYHGVVHLMYNYKLIIALGFYSIATILWVVALKGIPLRLAYPFAALAFIIVPTFANLFLDEAVTWRTYLGGCIIIFGVYISAN